MAEAPRRAPPLLRRRGAPEGGMRQGWLRPPAATGDGLRRFVAISVGVHVAAALVALLWWLPAARPREVPATVEVLFGDNADTPGARAAAAPVPPAAPAIATAIASAADGPQPAASAGPAAGAAAPAAPPLPVRLGEGDVGLKLSDPPDPGIIEAASDPGNRAPKYPEIAWRQQQSGRVVIRLHIDTQGRVSEAEVLESSGYPALDRAAREALARWHFIPALHDGIAVPSFRDQATNFVLN